MSRDRTTSAAPVSHVFRGYRPTICRTPCAVHPLCICTQHEAAKALEERVGKLEARIRALEADGLEGRGA